MTLGLGLKISFEQLNGPEAGAEIFCLPSTKKSHILEFLTYSLELKKNLSNSSFQPLNMPFEQ